MLTATNTKATVSPLEIDEEFVHVTPPASPNQPDRENKSNASISIDMHASALPADRLASVSNSQLNISGELKEDAAENKISALTTSMNINEMLIKSLDAAVIKIISEELSNMKHTHDKTVLLNKMSKNLLTMSQNNLKKVEEQRIINSYNKTKNF